ncbi:MAG: PEP-CTERM sorting domain-containing protein [Kiritimatiellales bacterium]
MSNKKNIKSWIVAVPVIFIAVTVSAQDIGDYRWNKSDGNAGNHNNITFWRVYDGTDWQTTSVEPGNSATIVTPVSGAGNLRVNATDWTVGSINLNLAENWTFSGYMTGASLSVTGDVAKAGNSTWSFINGGGSNTISFSVGGDLNVSGGSMILGGGTSRIQAFNATGSTTINGSLYIAANAAALKTVNLNSGGVLTVMEANSGSGGVTLSGLNSVSGNGIVAARAIANANSVNNAPNGTLTINGTSGTFSYGGAIQDKTGLADDRSTLSIVKSGDSTQIFNGTGSYSGTTAINGGALIINGDFSAVTNTFTVAAAAILGDTGEIGAEVDFAAGAMLMFDSMLTVAKATFADFDIHDIGGLDSSTALNTYALISGDIAGTIADGVANAIGLGGGKSAYLELTGTGLNLVVVPEPSIMGIFLVSGTVLFAIRKRKI